MLVSKHNIEQKEDPESTRTAATTHSPASRLSGSIGNQTNPELRQGSPGMQDKDILTAISSGVAEIRGAACRGGSIPFGACSEPVVLRVPILSPVKALANIATVQSVVQLTE